MDTAIANDVRAEPTGSPERPHRAGGGEPVGGPSRRFSAHRKLEAVRRLMRGEALELVARELNVTAGRLPKPRRGLPHSPQVLHLICESSVACSSKRGFTFLTGWPAPLR